MKKQKLGIKQQRNAGTKQAILIFLCFFVPLLLNAATVLIPLQTCGISPAADRNVTLTPLQALGSNSIPLMDKIQGATDTNGNWSPTLLPGVYQADVLPVWGAVGVTEFYFYVDPSNTVQNAFANLLTGTNNTCPPNQYAYTAQASDARYVMQGGYLVAITNLNNAYATSWITNQYLEWWSADMISTNNGSLITNWIGHNGNVMVGNAWYSAQGVMGHWV